MLGRLGWHNGAVRKRDSGLKAEIAELTDLLKAYVVQETVGPLRGLGRYLAFGFLGAVALSISALTAALALVRVLQTETGVFGANWSFVPHLAGALLLAAIVAAMVWAIRPRRSASRRAERDATAGTAGAETAAQGDSQRSGPDRCRPAGNAGAEVDAQAPSATASGPAVPQTGERTSGGSDD